jgi:hypothetical protein
MTRRTPAEGITPLAVGATLLVLVAAVVLVPPVGDGLTVIAGWCYRFGSVIGHAVVGVWSFLTQVF